MKKLYQTPNKKKAKAVSDVKIVMTRQNQGFTRHDMLPARLANRVHAPTPILKKK